MFYTYILTSLFEKFEKNHPILRFASRDCKVTSFGRVESFWTVRISDGSRALAEKRVSPAAF